MSAGYFFSNNIVGKYSLENVLNWKDVDFVTNYEFISDILEIKEKFILSENIKTNIIFFCVKIMRLCGYAFVKNNVIQVKELKRSETQDKILVGLYSKSTWDIIIKLLNFLKKLDLQIISNYFTLALCYASKKDKVIESFFEEYKNNIYQTQTFLEKFRNKFCLLEHKNNSCYQDSVFASLFAIETNFVDKNILYGKIQHNTEVIFSKDKEKDIKIKKEVQEYFVKLVKSIRCESEHIKNVTEFKEIIKQTEIETKENFYQNNTHDAGEFLQFIFGIFGTNTLEEEKIVKIGKDNEEMIETGKTKNKIFPIISIHFLYLENEEKISLQDFLVQEEFAELSKDNLFSYKNEKYNKRLEIKKFYPEDFLVFYVQRLSLESRITKEISIPEKIGNLELYSIVVHRSNHYVCFFKSKDWFYYDDLRSEIDNIGNFENVINHSKEPKKNGILFFYK